MDTGRSAGGCEAELELVRFADADGALFDELARGLDVPEICRHAFGRGFAFGLPIADGIRWRVERDRAGETLHLVVVRDDSAVGWVGWTPDGDGVESTTYLVPAVWGSGINTRLKALSWQVAREAGRPLTVACAVSNARSRASIEKHWPANRGQQIWAPVIRRRVIVYHPDREPRGYRPWASDVVGPLAQSVARIAG